MGRGKCLFPGETGQQEMSHNKEPCLSWALSLGPDPAAGRTGDRGDLERGWSHTLHACLQLHWPRGAHCESGPVPGLSGKEPGASPSPESIEELLCMLCMCLSFLWNYSSVWPCLVFFVLWILS